jgi:hypothetical protein
MLIIKFVKFELMAIVWSNTLYFDVKLCIDHGYKRLNNIW